MLKLPGIAPGRQTRRPAMVEDTAQEAAVAYLRAAGYEVLVTTVRLRWSVCPRCDARVAPRYATGQTQGIPDLLVTHAGWPAGAWVGVELKGTHTQLSAEQRDLAERGRILVLRAQATPEATGREAVRLVREFGARMPADARNV